MCTNIAMSFWFFFQLGPYKPLNQNLGYDKKWQLVSMEQFFFYTESVYIFALWISVDSRDLLRLVSAIFLAKFSEILVCPRLRKKNGLKVTQ